jgi:hypothetical protein
MEDFMAEPTHLRLPQRAEAVVGPEQQPLTAAAPAMAIDPRTVTQDPALKAKIKSAEEPKQQGAN